MKCMQSKLHVNGFDYDVILKPHENLREVLRRIGFKGVKKSCDVGGCGVCTVLLDGRPVYSCCTFAAWAEGKQITTVEGLASPEELDLIQRNFVEKGASQCGFCTPGLVLVAEALLKRNPQPSEAEVRREIAGNICRCTGYVKVVDAILAASKKR